MKLDRLRVEPVAGREAGKPDLGIEVEQKRSVGDEAPGGEPIGGADELGIEPARDGLVDESGIGVAVAQHPLPLGQSGTNEGGDVVRPVGKEQKELGGGGHVLAVKEDLADALTELPGSGLPSGDNIETTLPQPLGDSA